jgi:uncharacterized membrane protein
MQPMQTTPVTRGELRSFAFTVGAAFAVLALVAAVRGRLTVMSLFGIVALALTLGGYLAPERLGTPYRAWMAFALALSRVTTPLMMGVVYFAVLTPIGLALRLVGRRPLRHVPRGASAWVRRSEGRRRGDMRRQF